MLQEKQTFTTIRRLIARLKEDENWIFQAIGDHLNMNTGLVQTIYKRSKSYITPKKTGRLRATIERGKI